MVLLSADPKYHAMNWTEWNWTVLHISISWIIYCVKDLREREREREGKPHLQILDSLSSLDRFDWIKAARVISLLIPKSWTNTRVTLLTVTWCWISITRRTMKLQSHKESQRIGRRISIKLDKFIALFVSRLIHKSLEESWRILWIARNYPVIKLEFFSTPITCSLRFSSTLIRHPSRIFSTTQEDGKISTILRNSAIWSNYLDAQEISDAIDVVPIWSWYIIDASIYGRISNQIAGKRERERKRENR